MKFTMFFISLKFGRLQPYFSNFAYKEREFSQDCVCYVFRLFKEEMLTNQRKRVVLPLLSVFADLDVNM